MKITRLSQSVKKPDSYTAEFEDGGRLTVTVALIADFSLFTGRELDEAELAALEAAASAQRTRARALRILGARNMSRKEMTDRLVQKGESEEAAEDTADWLTAIGAVNDVEYASLIVRHYASRGYGKKRIVDELYRRGIDRELWDTALEALPETEDKVMRLLESKLGGEKPDRAALKRATDALYRRGFSWEEIKTAVARYMERTEDTYGEE